MLSNINIDSITEDEILKIFLKILFQKKETISELLLESIHNTFYTSEKPMAYTATYSNIAINLGTIFVPWMLTTGFVDIPDRIKKDVEDFQKVLKQLYFAVFGLNKDARDHIYNLIKTCNIFIFMNDRSFEKLLGFFVIKDTNLINKEATQLMLKIGSFLIDNLISLKILKEISTGRTTYVTIAVNYKDSLWMSATYIKPVLYSTQTSKVDFKFKRNKFSFTVSNARQNYMKTAKTFTYEVLLTTRKLVSNTSPYRINTRFFKLYINYLKELDKFIFNINTSMLIKPFTFETQHVVNYILIHYDFDIYQLKQTSKNDAFIQNLLDFIKDGDNLYDSTAFKNI